jgi:DNA replication and repair protein RecF
MRALSRIALTDFRNYAAVALDLKPGPVALFGANGAGKTNLMEAVSLLAPGKGLRGADLPELARQGCIGWSISAQLVTPEADEPYRLGVSMERNPEGAARRVGRLDGAAATPGALGEVLRVVWLTPAQDRLFAEAAGERRRFLDRLALALHPGHGQAASRYEKAMRERTKILEDVRPSTSWVEGLEVQMAEHGAAVIAARADVTARLNQMIELRPDGAFPKAILSCGTGLPDVEADAGSAAMQNAIQEVLARNRRRDGEAGRALQGPHRAEFVARHRSKDMPAADCSTGEQKALLVGIVLAHARLVTARTGIAPFLLLDEACAHLDSLRRAALAEEISCLEGQTWMTGTDAHLFDAFDTNTQRFEVASATINQMA